MTGPKTGSRSVPHTTPQSGVKQPGRGVFRKLQAGLCVPSVLGDNGRGEASAPGEDRALQPASTAQRIRDAVASRLLRGMDGQKQDTACPKLSGAVHSFRTSSSANLLWARR